MATRILGSELGEFLKGETLTQDKWGPWHTWWERISACASDTVEGFFLKRGTFKGEWGPSAEEETAASWCGVSIFIEGLHQSWSQSEVTQFGASVSRGPPSYSLLQTRTWSRVQSRAQAQAGLLTDVYVAFQSFMADSSIPTVHQGFFFESQSIFPFLYLQRSVSILQADSFLTFVLREVLDSANTSANLSDVA